MTTSKLKNGWQKTFFPFWISQIVSILGSELVMFTLVWWLTEKTGSATVLATATMFGMIPEIVVQPFAGAIVDRLNQMGDHPGRWCDRAGNADPGGVVLF